MKNMKKLFSLLLVLVLALAVCAPAFAEDPAAGTITVTAPSGGNSTDVYTYSIYKVFDATSDGSSSAISYSVMASKAGVALPDGFVTDSAGNVIHGTKDASTGEVTPSAATELTAAEIAAIKTYIGSDAPVATATANPGGTATFSGLDYGYYYISTTLGTAVTVDSNNPTAAVNDKNTVPVLTKAASAADAGSIDAAGANAIAQVGTDVTFTASITVGNGAVNYKFHDKMSSGLSFKGNSSVTVSGIGADQYTLQATPDSGDDLTISFADGIASGTVITISYKATVTSDALQTDPANNTASLDYGDDYHTTQQTVNVYNASFTVSKVDGDNAALAGAGFVISKTESGAVKYYKLESGVVSWVDDIANATELTTAVSGGEAKVSFTGLADGTYTLIEKTVPSGYNKAADQSFTIAAADVSEANLTQTATVVNKAGTELPSTGGVGTTIFYSVGAVLVLGAAVVLLARKRVSE